MPNMTDRNTSGNNFVNWILQAFFCLSATTTYTPGTGGGSAKTVTVPFLVALMTAVGSNVANGTEATIINCPGYTPLSGGGKSLGSPAFGTPAAGVILNTNSVSWTATGAWSAILGIEIWDSAATKLRWLQGAITSISVANANTLIFPISSLSGDASQW